MNVFATHSSAEHKDSSSVLAMLHKAVVLTIAASALLLLTACSDDDDDGEISSSARVVSVQVANNVLRVGEGTVASIDFTYDSGDIFEDNDSLILVVRLPKEVQYRDNTSEIDSIGRDEGVGARVLPCATGESYLTYTLDRNDLARAENPAGDADARLTLTFDAIAPTAAAGIAAKGDRVDIANRCDDIFRADADAIISIIP